MGGTRQRMRNICTGGTWNPKTIAKHLKLQTREYKIRPTKKLKTIIAKLRQDLSTLKGKQMTTSRGKTMRNKLYRGWARNKHPMEMKKNGKNNTSAHAKAMSRSSRLKGNY